MSMSIYDRLLRQVIEHLYMRWMEPGVGIVAAGVFDGARWVIETSESPTRGKWVHAERNAVLSFRRKYGEPSHEAVVVSTLSPCTKVKSESRIGSSCTEFLLGAGISRVHVGILDSQSEKLVGYEQKYGMYVTLTEDESCRTNCQNLHDMFETFGAGLNWTLPAIKEQIKYRVFDAS